MEFGHTHDATHTMYPSCSKLIDLDADTAFLSSPQSSVYGFVIEGSLKIKHRDGSELVVPAGHAFAINDQYTSRGPAKLWTVNRYGYNVVTSVTKPEHKGRLTYIDGCSDSLLIYPSRLGDSSLNLLYFPPKIDQSWHTHPSIRLGYVASGKGIAHWRDEKGDHTQPLLPGDSFMLPEHASHRFCTDDSEMRILAFHPDGDWGPEDHNHTMRNRTYLNK